MSGRPMRAKLVGHDVVICETFEEWAPWAKEYIEKNRPVDEDPRVVACEEVARWSSDDVVTVSTCFIGLNTSFTETPTWFETIVFASGAFAKVHGQRERYGSWVEAEIGHAFVVNAIRDEIDKGWYGPKLS